MLCTAIFTVFGVLIAQPYRYGVYSCDRCLYSPIFCGKRQQITIFQQWRHPLFAILIRLFLSLYPFGYYGTGPASKARASNKRGYFRLSPRDRSPCAERVHIQRPQRTVFPTLPAFPFVDIFRSIAERAAQQFPDVFCPVISQGIDKRILPVWYAYRRRAINFVL